MTSYNQRREPYSYYSATLRPIQASARAQRLTFKRKDNKNGHKFRLKCPTLGRS